MKKDKNWVEKFKHILMEFIDFIFETFVWFVLIICSGIAIAVGFALPKFGILSLVIAVGFELISMYSEYQERKRNENL